MVECKLFNLKRIWHEKAIKKTNIRTNQRIEILRTSDRNSNGSSAWLSQNELLVLLMRSKVVYVFYDAFVVRSYIFNASWLESDTDHPSDLNRWRWLTSYSHSWPLWLKTILKIWSSVKKMPQIGESNFQIWYVSRKKNEFCMHF